MQGRSGTVTARVCSSQKLRALHLVMRFSGEGFGSQRHVTGWLSPTCVQSSEVSMCNWAYAAIMVFDECSTMHTMAATAATYDRISAWAIGGMLSRDGATAAVQLHCYMCCSQPYVCN